MIRNPVWNRMDFMMHAIPLLAELDIVYDARDRMNDTVHAVPCRPGNPLSWPP